MQQLKRYRACKMTLDKPVIYEQVYVANERRPNCSCNINDGIAWTEVSGIPADIADGDANTQLNEAQVDAFRSR